MTNTTSCKWNNPDVCPRGILKECNHCGEILCTYHFDTMAHIVYGCICKICGVHNRTGCTHGVPEWSKSEVK